MDDHITAEVDDVQKVVDDILDDTQTGGHLEKALDDHITAEVDDVQAVVDHLKSEYVLINEIKSDVKNQRVRDTAANIAKYPNDTANIVVGDNNGSIASFASEIGKLIQPSKAFNNLQTAEGKAGKNLFDSEIHITGTLEGTVKQITDQVADVRAKKRANFTITDFRGTVNNEAVINVADAKKLIDAGLVLDNFVFNVEDMLGNATGALNATYEKVITKAASVSISSTIESAAFTSLNSVADKTTGILKATVQEGQAALLGGNLSNLGKTDEIKHKIIGDANIDQYKIILAQTKLTDR